MLAAILFMLCFLQICCGGGLLDNSYQCVEAFALAEFAASLGWQLYCYLHYAMGIVSPVAGGLVLVLTYVVVYGLALVMSRYIQKQGILAVSGWELLFAAVIGLAIFLMSNLSFTFANTPFSANYSSMIFNIRTLVDLGGMAFLYAYHFRCLSMQFNYELKTMESLLEYQFNQYQQTKETLDMVNYQYHDLKNHMIVLRAEEGNEDRQEYLDQLEASINDYEMQNKTGNKVLDIILTDKGMTCRKDHIELTTVVDGARLNFIEDIDLCSLFGNALDNAIECEQKVEDEKKRMIHLSVYSQRAFLIIRCENYCEENVVTGKDLPKTTKEGEQAHGYGLKIIRRIAQKYGGEADVSTEGNSFILKILIPIPETDKADENTTAPAG